MKRLIVLLALVGAMFTVNPSTALAQETEGSVSATVTPAFISVLSTALNVGYGVVDLDTTGNLPVGQGSASSTAAFLVENNGTKTSDWNIVGGPSTPDNWTILGANAADTYAHFYGTDGDGSGNPVSPTSMHTSTGLSSNVPSASSTAVWLSLDMPTSGTATAQQTLPITITAVIP